MEKAALQPNVGDRALPRAGDEVLAFGPFRLDLVRHVLWEAGKPVRLGGRALHILLALVERAGQTVGSPELLARVWQDRIVEPGALRVHIAALRKILRDQQFGIRYVENVSGQGYRFVAPVTRVHERPVSAATPASLSGVPPSGEPGSMPYRADNLPAMMTRMLGREQVLSTLSARVPQRRFVTITGPGGIGKTTLALSVAATLAPTYPQGACYVDLALLSEPGRASSALAAALGLATLAADTLPDILTFLRDKSLLLVLDNCEHVIDVAANLAQKVLRGAPSVHVIATSREPLYAEGEFVHRLEPLALPEGGDALTRAEALAFPALQLFVERAEASMDTFELRDAEIPQLAQICRRLDGNPLAIELAAAHVAILGLAGLAASLDEGSHLLIRGRRTAMPRQQTLRATLDWSYDLLTASEQAILRRLAVFVGSFDLRSASTVATDETLDRAEVLEGLGRLVAKSLLVADVTGEMALSRRKKRSPAAVETDHCCHQHLCSE
jgi:predicted ATPase/DNA-binding winged helix-turn-helix (wHTH) protein